MISTFKYIKNYNIYTESNDILKYQAYARTLIKYIRANDIDSIKKYIDNNNNINYRNSNGETPLMYAVYIKNIDIIKLLLDNNANVNINDINNNTVLQFISNYLITSNSTNISDFDNILQKSNTWNKKNTNGDDFIDILKKHKNYNTIIKYIINNHHIKYNSYLNKKTINNFNI